jgi:predicted TIM-barrel fold metal-dependent hydrolase
MIIDSHSHSCGKFLHGKDIISELDKYRIAKIVLVPGKLNSDKDYSLPNIAKLFPNRNVVKITNLITKPIIKLTGSINDIETGNEYVYSLVEQYPDRIIQFYWCVLNSPEVLNKLKENYNIWTFKGLKVHQCWEHFTYKSQIFNNIAKFARENNLSIFVHSYSKKDVTDLIEYVKINPSTKIIVGHLFGLEQFIESGLEYSNVYFEISTPQLVSMTRLIKAINHFGANKILFGSDVPYGKNNQKLNIDRIRSLDISEVEKERILGNNIREILSI